MFLFAFRTIKPRNSNIICRPLCFCSLEASIHAASKALKCEHTYGPGLWNQLWSDANDSCSGMQSRNVPTPVSLSVYRHTFRKKDKLNLVTRVVAQVDRLPSAQDQVLIVDNSDNTLTLMNLTNQEIQNIRVFYKNYDESLGCYLGGVTYSGTVESIVAGESITVAPEHFVSGSSVIMGSEILKSQIFISEDSLNEMETIAVPHFY